MIFNVIILFLSFFINIKVRTKDKPIIPRSPNKGITIVLYELIFGLNTPFINNIELIILTKRNDKSFLNVVKTFGIFIVKQLVLFTL